MGYQQGKMDTRAQDGCQRSVLKMSPPYYLSRMSPLSLRTHGCCVPNSLEAQLPTWSWKDFSMHRRSVNDSGDRHGDGTRQYPLDQQFGGQHMVTLLDCLGSNRSLPQFPVPFRFRGDGGEGCEMTPSPQPPHQNSENFTSSTGPIRERVCCGHDGTPRSGQASKVSPTLWVPQCSAGLSTRIFGVPLDLQGYSFQKAQMGPVFPNSLGAQRIPKGIP